MLFLRRANEQRSTLANRDTPDVSRDETLASQITTTTTWGALADTSRFFESQRGQRVGAAQRSQLESLISDQADGWIERTRSRLQAMDLDTL